MATIKIGGSAISSVNNTGPMSNYTYVTGEYPADGTGTLTSMSFYLKTSATGLKCGTFSRSSNNLTGRDFETIGNVSAGSKQTFTGLSCSVSLNDILGVYAGNSDANMYVTISSNNYWYYYGDKMGSASTTFDFVNGAGNNGVNFSMEASGETVSIGKKINNVILAKWNDSPIVKWNNQ